MRRPDTRRAGDSLAPEPRARIKTLLLVTSTAGGAGLHTYYLARHLPRATFDLTVAFGPGYPLDAKFADLDVPVVHLALARSLAPVANLRAAWQLWRLMRRERFDLVCAACSIAGALGRLAAWATGVPRRVFILHAYASQPNQSRLARTIYRGVERALDRLTTHYYAVSDATRRFGVEHGLFAADKVTVIPNGIPVPPPPTEERAAIRSALGIPVGAPLIVTAGRLEAQKGLPHLLDAFALVRRELPAARLLIVGDGPERSALVAQADRLGVRDVLHLPGWRSDVPRLIHAGDVFCLASLWESFGLVLVEAMAMCRPVVASRVDGIPEVVVDGETGLLVPPAQPRPLAEALAKVLRDPTLAERLGRAGRLRAAAQFALEPLIARFSRELADHVGSARHARAARPEPGYAPVAESAL